MMKIRLFNAMLWLIIGIAITLKVSAESLPEFAQRLTRVPSLLETSIPYPDSANLILNNNATCFALSITTGGQTISWYIVSNYHAIVFKDKYGSVLAQVDSARVMRNARDKTTSRDSVISIRATVVKANPALDLTLFQLVEGIPERFDIDRSGISIDLSTANRQPRVGERIVYCGFPLLLGKDTTLTKNYPVVIEGSVAQVVPEMASFVVQAPVFSGASGSPILSGEDGVFLGIVYARVPGQESLLYGIKATTFVDWLKTVVSSAPPPSSSNKK